MKVEFFPIRLHLRLVAIVLALVLNSPLSSSADLFYRVEASIGASGLNPAANQTVPMVVTGLNAAGRVVGFYALHVAGAPGLLPQNPLHAFIWDDATQTQRDLNADMAGFSAASSMALCVNDGGTVAGVCWLANVAANGPSQVGFIWQNGVGTTFASPIGMDIDAVIAINASGHVIGTYYDGNDANKRAFFYDGTTCVDLGDLGDSANPYLWPRAINDADQIVGTSYGTDVNPPTRTAFLWQNSVIDVLEGTDDFGNTTGVSINNAGEVVGQYATQPTPAHPHSSISGGFYWFGDEATDLLSLGNGGTVPFRIDASGTAFGTAYGTDNTLHLFSWNTGAMADLGAASLSATDLSYQLTSVNGTGVAAGFIVDASNHLQAVVSVGGSERKVVDLLPSYLAFTQMSSAYGSQVLVNDAGQIACAATNASGQQMALLLSVDPDTDNDGLPDSWEMQYYGHLGVDKNALEAGGGGLTNWQAYQKGTDPNDFYHGQGPRLSKVSGDGQTAAPNSFVAYPLVVQVANANGVPAQGGVPVTFSSAAGGGHLQASNQASAKTTVVIQSDANGQAKIFFQAPGTANTPCTVAATVTVGSQSALSSFSEGSGGSDLPPNPAPTDPNNPVTPQTPPAQSYAAIDVSGAMQGNNNVTMVALDDQGSVACGWNVGQNANGQPAQFQVATWANGTATLANPLLLDCEDLFMNGALSDGSQEFAAHLYVKNLLPNGRVFGDVGVPEGGYYDHIFSALDGAFTDDYVSPSCYVVAEPGNFPHFLSVASDGNYVGRWIYYAGATYNDPSYPYNVGQAAVIPHGGQTDIFDLEAKPGFNAGPNTQIHSTEYFEPYANNVNGWAVGRAYSPLVIPNGPPVPTDPLVGEVIWDGQAFHLIDTLYPMALNDQNQIIVHGAGIGTGQAEGYLWENGTSTVLVNHLPRELQGQIANIQPFAISNQTAPGTDATIYLLATATVNGAANTTIVCTRNNDGVWSFAQVGVPDGTTISQYATINSSGVIAVIGNFANVTNQSQAHGVVPSDTPTPSPSQAGLLSAISLSAQVQPGPATLDDGATTLQNGTTTMRCPNVTVRATLNKAFLKPNTSNADQLKIVQDAKGTITIQGSV